MINLTLQFNFTALFDVDGASTILLAHPLRLLRRYYDHRVSADGIVTITLVVLSCSASCLRQLSLLLMVPLPS
jgi:hypothetical protein